MEKIPSSVWSSITQCKTIEKDDAVNKSKLAKVLNLFQLVTLGIGSTLGMGVYIISGSLAKTTAGPAVILSFLITAIVVILQAMCYAEIAARIPTTGSSYVYSYASVGELVGFIIGWNIIFGGIVGTASISKGISNYVDSLVGNVFREFFMEHMPINLKYFAQYPDFFACLITIVVSLIVASGAKSSVRFSNFLTMLNLTTIAIIIAAGATKVDFANWQISVDNITEEYRSSAGSGGFMPFGISGVILATSKCIFAFAGFEIITATGEEAKNPKRDIPLGIALTVSTVTIVYLLLAGITTLMWPYYLQDINAPFPHVFEQLGMPILKWIVTIGAVVAMSTVLVSSIFYFPRILYCMSCDGLLFRKLSGVNKKTQTPLLAIAISGILSGIATTLFDLNQLIDMMSLTGLFNNTIICIAVLVLRYKNDLINSEDVADPDNTDHCTYTPWKLFKNIFNLHRAKYPTKLSCLIAKCAIFAFLFVAFGFCACVTWISNETIKFFTMSMLGVFVVMLWIIIARQPMYSVDHLIIKVPFITCVSCLTVVLELYLIVQLNYEAWLKFLIWFAIGFFVYFTYSIRNSEERKIKK